MQTTGTQLFETWFRRVWKENDTKAIFEMFPDGKAKGLGSQDIGNPEGFQEFREKLCNLVQNIEITIDKSVEDNDWTALLCVLKGNCRSTGKPVSMTGTVFGRIKDGHILQAYNHWDFHGLWVQLGLLPKDSFDRCLNGEKIG